MAGELSEKIERLREHCHAWQLGFYLQWSAAEGCWYGQITSAAPEEEMEFKRFSTIDQLVDQMSDHVGVARS